MHTRMKEKKTETANTGGAQQDVKKCRSTDKGRGKNRLKQVRREDE